MVLLLNNNFMENNNEQEIEKSVIKQDGIKKIVSTLIIIGVFVVGAILLRGTSPKDNNIVDNTDIDFSDIIIRPISPDEHILGNINAEIMIVEYSDTECPFCKRFHTTMNEIVKNNGDKVAWVYRHYPIPQLHKKAFLEAEATECAWEQGGNTQFWNFTNELYKRTQSNDSLEVTELPKIAGDIGINVESFNACLLSGKYTSKVEADIMDGQLVGVRGTPTSFVLQNGVMVDVIEGAQPIEIVQEKIDRLR